VVNRHLGVGWEFVHVCIDDASRVAFSQIMKDERKESAGAFLETAAAYYLSLGVKVERVMTDNGSCYLSQAFRQACRRLGLKHVRTKPYTPRTNGKAERFIHTSLREWAYAQASNSSAERTDELATMAPSPQLASAPCQHRRQTANQPSRSARGQPLVAPQLATSCGRQV
jgi:transposase InsO family protein